jgi:hypothetical protein
MTKAALNVIDLYIQSDFCRGGNGENEDELLTDRALVAAAPDLLAALENVLLAHKYDGALTNGTAALSPAIADTIERAINKAKGN